MMNRGRRPATIDLGLGTERQRGKFHRGGRAWKTSRSRMHASRRSGTVPRRAARRQRARTDRDAMARARVFAPSTRRRALCTLAARSHRTYWLCCATRRAFSLFPGEMHALLCARQGGRAHLALVRRRLSLAGRRSVPGRGNWPDRRTRGAGALLASYLPMPASPSRELPRLPTCRASSRPKLLYDRSVSYCEPFIVLITLAAGGQPYVWCFSRGEMSSMLYTLCIRTHISCLNSANASLATCIAWRFHSCQFVG
jgi:hypothetical protein